MTEPHPRGYIIALSLVLFQNNLVYGRCRQDVKVRWSCRGEIARGIASFRCPRVNCVDVGPDPYIRACEVSRAGLDANTVERGVP